jgi:hypothetical protein
MNEVLEAPCWETVGSAIEQNQRDFLAGRHTLAEDLVAWFRAVDLFRETQDERMILRAPTLDDLRQHRTWVVGLIAEGERLLTEALSRGGLPDGAARFKLADVEATLEILHLAQREWHGPKMPARGRREILKAVFRVEDPQFTLTGAVLINAKAQNRSAAEPQPKRKPASTAEARRTQRRHGFGKPLRSCASASR